ncbi:septum formation inhibitor Maf [Rhodococcus sp. D2-41]|uniref:Maf family protein n=1 Tax=Speluncibacter jeojiensis TaxID=2710754 RepID=UPI0024107F6D|nr:Maf family protein [Rhodococcus sp. D2-41]MDG3008830.1 septum formation inhibitor Maf [Rhodococcus sp. D2-41]
MSQQEGPTPAGPRFVLASASPARLSVLRAAGVEPLVRVSDVDEDAVAAALGPDATPEHVVTALATAKAREVLRALSAEYPHGGVLDDAVIVGCDSMLHVDGRLEGKPHTPEVARARWEVMRGRSGALLTGHCVLRVHGGRLAGEVADHSTTTVHFSSPTDADLDAYLATGEPLKVAGAFTLDGLGGWFVEGIEGDPSSVIGIGLPLVRRLLGDLGVGVAELWAANRT